MKSSVITLHWLPRIICILAILFISKYAINSIESYLTIWQQILTLLVHLVPCVLLAALLIIAWKWELAGGILFIVIGLALTPVIFKHNYNLNESIATSLGIVTMITFPLLVIGNLFTFSYIKRRKYRMMMNALKQSRVQKIERYKLLKYNEFQNIKYYPPLAKEEDKVLQPMEEA